MKFSALQLSEILQGTIEGDAEVCVDRLAKIEEGTPGSVSFLANPKYTHYIYSTKASVVIVANDFRPCEKVSATLVRVENPYTAFTTLLEFYDKCLRSLKTGTEQPSFQAEDAVLGENLYLGAFSYVGSKAEIGDVKIYPQAYIGENVKIGRGTVVYAGVKIYPGTVIGENCTLHAGAVVGSDGFGFAPQMDGTYKKIPQTGIVVIEDNVEIGANTTIDRATMGSTVIRKGTKLDNLIQVAHNDEIGANTVMAAQVGIAGSTKIGEWCMFGGQVGIAGHIHIGNKVNLGAQSGVPSNIKDGSQLIGTPPMDPKQYLSLIHI